MKISLHFVLWIITNILGLSIIALVKPLSLILSYGIGGVYTGILLGTAFSLYILSYKEVLSTPLSKLFDVSSINTPITMEWRWRGNKYSYFIILGLGILLAIMTIIEGYTFYGQALGNNPMASVTIIGITGAVYGMILLVSVVWFELLVWQDKVRFYAIAVVANIFLIAVVSGFSTAFFEGNLLFVVALASKNIVSVFNKYNEIVKTKRIHYIFTAIVFMLCIPVIYR